VGRYKFFIFRRIIINSIDIFSAVFLLLLIVIVIFTLGNLASYFEEKHRRSKFIKNYRNSFNDNKKPINFDEVEAIAITDHLSNTQVVKALDECLASLVKDKDESISREELKKIRSAFRVASKFEDIPENMRGHIDNLKALLPGNNSDLYKLESEIQDFSKIQKRNKFISFFVFITGLTGTIYTVLGYYNIGNG